jgi:hypothetical protein
MCGARHVCEPSPGAVAGLARITYLLNEGTFVPYLSGILGFGVTLGVAFLLGFPVFIHLPRPRERRCDRRAMTASDERQEA